MLAETDLFRVKLACVMTGGLPRQTMPNEDKEQQPITITLVTKQDEAAVRRMLFQSGQPYEEFSAHLDHFLVARRAKDIVGAIGLEYQGGTGLLQSIVVEDRERRRGIGRRLCIEMIKCAQLAGVRELYVLTESAENFFASCGFKRIDRDATPKAIATRRPSSEPRLVPAICMKLSIERTKQARADGGNTTYY